jgi:Cu2+-exporting ATPase
MSSSITNRKDSFPVLKLSCAGCAANVQRTLRKQPGVKSANVNFANKTALVEYNSAVTNAEKLQLAVREAGYDLITPSEEDDSDDAGEQLEAEEQRQYRRLKARTVMALSLSAGLIVLSMTPLMHQLWAGYVTGILATPILFICGQPFFAEAWRQAKHRQMNMDTLVALSTATAYLFSVFSLLFTQLFNRHELHTGVYFETAGVLVAFILLGKLLEEKAKRKTAGSVKKLIGLQPKTATIIRPGGALEETPVKDIRRDDVVFVKAGEKIAVDGTVTEGYSFVDESMITGEPIPAEKTPGWNVFAGTVNRQGSFKFRATNVGRKTLLAQIIQLVTEAQNTKAPIQKLVDKVAGIFVPTVAGIALLSALLWLFFGGENAVTHALLAFITVLIIACPCALGLATPTAIMVGMGKGAEQGILVKDMDSLETLRRVNTIVLDKTGTITKGAPVVTDVKWMIPEPDSSSPATAKLCSILFRMEKASGHPLADAIIAVLPSADLENALTLEVKPGAGVETVIGNDTFRAGNLRLFQWASKEKDISDWINAREKEGKTVVLFGSDAQIYVLFALSDEIKESSKQAIEQIQSAGIEAVMATGDNETAAMEIARQSGIKEYLAHALPEDKLRLIEKKQHSGRIVAMVGDGINDSAALAQADVSIAMGKGNDVAIEAASVVIVSGDLRKISAAIHLSQNTVATIRQNLFWAFIYNLIGIPLAAGVLYPVNGFVLNPMIAGAAMALSSVSVVINSLRFNGFRRRKSDAHPCNPQNGDSPLNAPPPASTDRPAYPCAPPSQT